MFFPDFPDRINPVGDNHFSEYTRSELNPNASIFMPKIYYSLNISRLIENVNMGIKKSGLNYNARNNRSLSISNVLNKSSICVPTLNGENVTISTVLLNTNAESFIPISQKHVTYPVCKVSSPRYYSSSLPQNHANDIFIDINQKQYANSYSSVIPPSAYCTYELNPCADIFVPHKSKMNVNCKIIAVIAISFILSILIIYTIYINGKHDSTENSPQYQTIKT